MKKILLLIILSISILSTQAQSSRNKPDNQQVKTIQYASNTASTEGFIENITVYPNPVVEELKISFKSSHRNLSTVSLFNNIGKLVYTQGADVEPGNNIISIDIRSKSIDPGVYFVQIVIEKQSFTRKLIVK